MEKIARGKRASEAQKEYLINYLQMHVELATDKFVTVDCAKCREEKWKKLAEDLNALGGTIKDGAKWRKYWSDLRLNTRAKYCQLKRQEERSGVNGMRTKALTEVEEKIIQITTTEALDGDDTPEIGFDMRTDVGKENDDIQDSREEHADTTEVPVSSTYDIEE